MMRDGSTRSVVEIVRQAANKRSEMVTGPRGVVLVVEDDASMRDAIERLLGEAGYTTAGYASVEGLLAGGGIGSALCIISDITLPAMSGFELIGELRARGLPTPVILITAYDSAAVRSEAKLQGATAYLAKPFMGSALLVAIDGVSPPARP
jgi:FixJ family two-component response regulator